MRVSNDEVIRAKEEVRKQTIDRMRAKYPTVMGNAFARDAERKISKELGIPSELYYTAFSSPSIARYIGVVILSSTR